MSRHVFHKELRGCEVGIGERVVRFDDHGVSPALTPGEHDRLLTIPGYEDAARPPAGLPEPLPADAAPGPADEEPIPEHEENRSLLNDLRGVAPELREEWYHGRPLVERLDLALHPELEESTAAQLFDWEARHRKSKQVLARLDTTLAKLRSSKDARQVTQAFLTAQFPVTPES